MKSILILDGYVTDNADETLLNNFIIFKDFNLDFEKKMEITYWFENQNYQLKDK